MHQLRAIKARLGFYVLVPANDYLMGLGTFRLLLALGVVASHTHGYIFSKYPDTGIIAVVTFFFISGYLIPSTFQTHYDVGSPFSRLRKYAINRALRIYPLYWVALVAALAIICFKGNFADYDLSPKAILQNVLLLGLNQDVFWGNDTKLIGPAWTLDIELQFYLLVPFLMLVKERFPRMFIVLLCTMSIIGLRLLLHPNGSLSIDRSILPYSIFFSLGMIVYFFKGNSPRLMKSPIYRIVASGLLIASLALFKQPGISQWLISLATIMVASALLQRPVSSLDKYLGDLSYPVFVLHSPLIILGIWPAETFFTSLLFNAATTLAVAAIAHWATSRHIEKLRSRNKDIPLSPVIVNECR